MIDFLKSQLAIQSGLSYVCALCEKYWGARDKNVPGGKCLSTEGCGSPIAGDFFHDYMGPLTVFDKFCFVCGNDSEYAISTSNSPRMFGCCAEHVEFVKGYKPSNKEEQNVIIISEGTTAPNNKSNGILKLKIA